MFGHMRGSPPPPPSSAMQLTSGPIPQVPTGYMRQAPSRSTVGLGTASIGVVFIFNLDVRVDEVAICDMITKGCMSNVTTESGVNGPRSSSSSFIQFRRVPGESFGFALFRAAAPAARAARALTGVSMFGKEIYCQPDKRTYQLLEQWRYLRGKELGAKISSQGYDIPSNILELVNTELTEQVNKAKGFVVESASTHELRLTRFAGLDEFQIFDKLEEDRVQEVLVTRAEEAGKIDKTNSELRVLMSQLAEQEKLLDVRELKQTSQLVIKRKFEQKTRTSSMSIFEIRQLIPRDRDTLFRHSIDWEGLFGVTAKKSKVIKSLVPWLIRKVKDFVGSYERELVEYILRRIRLRPDPLELTTDLRQYIDDDSEELVKQIWTILVFETIRKQNSQVIDYQHYAQFLSEGVPPSGLNDN